MSSISIQRISSVLLLVVLITGTTYAGDIVVVDQENLFGGDSSFYAYSTTLNQTFTPDLSAIDAVEVVLWQVTSYGEASVRLSLFEGAGIYGTLLGSSDPQTIAATEPQVYHFDFASTLALTPGGTYTLSLTSVDPTPVPFKWGVTIWNAYAGGSAVNNHGDELIPPDYFDFTFTEGLHGAVPVEIDIKPGSDPNSINLQSKGLLPVAIFSTIDFNALLIDEATILLGDPSIAGLPASPSRSVVEDTDGDGYDDLLLFFDVSTLNLLGSLDALSEVAYLTGETVDGVSIEGLDSVRMVPPNGRGNSGK
jgi:hypothetical protein